MTEMDWGGEMGWGGELHVRLSAKEEEKKAPVHAMNTVLLCVVGPPF